VDAAPVAVVLPTAVGPAAVDALPIVEVPVAPVPPAAVATAVWDPSLLSDGSLLQAAVPSVAHASNPMAIDR
jgi:hypothetical protein